MRAVPAVILAVLLLPLALAPLAEAAAPQGMAFNGQVLGDVKGPVRAVSADGPGIWSAVAIGDEPLNLQDVDLAGFNLESKSRWDAEDRDLPNEGAKLVAVANGTGGARGQWLVLVNNTVPNLLSIYQTTGQGLGGQPGRPVWQVDAQGTVNDIDMNADGKLFAAVTGAAAGNKSIFLVRNYGTPQAPRTLYRGTPTSDQFNDVVSFNAVALSANLTIPQNPGVQHAAYMVVGATVTSTAGVAGRVFVLETAFTGDLNAPPTRIIQTIDAGTPVISAAITADGEYAVVGTDAGLVYLLSISEALQKRGVSQIETQLGPWQQSLGSGVRHVAIAPLGGEFFAAGSEGGDVYVFRNERRPFGSEGAQAVAVASANVNTPGCGSQRLSGAVASMAMTDFGDVLLVGAQNGLMSFEAGAYARYRPGAFDPAWCIQYPQGDVLNGVFVDIAGDARRLIAGTGHRVFGYTNQYCLKLEPEGGPTRGGQPGQRAQWAVTVRNDGSLFDRVNLSLAGPQEPGWDLRISNTSLNLMPGRSQVVLVNVTSPQDVAPGNFSLVLTAAPERASRQAELQCSANQLSSNLRLDMGQLRRVEIRAPTTTLVATQGSPTTFAIPIHNGGNAEDTFRVSARIPDPEQSFKSPGSEWFIRVDPPELRIGPGNDGACTVGTSVRSPCTVDLIVTPNPANRGDFAIVEISVEAAVPSQEGFVGDVKQVTVAVEPSYAGDIQLVEVKDYRAEPGQQVFINFTVTNLGNSRDIFVLKNRTEPANAPGFLLQLSDERFELRTQNAKKVVRMSAVVQQGVQPGQSVRIVVDLFSEGLQRESPGSDGSVDSLPVTLTVVPKVRRGLPFAPEPLVLLAIVGVAVLAARRRGA